MATLNRFAPPLLAPGDETDHGSWPARPVAAPATGRPAGDAPPPEAVPSGHGSGAEGSSGSPNATARPGEVLARLLLAAVVAAILSSQHLLNVAERMPFGSTRSVLVAVAETLDDAVGVVQLDAPDSWLRQTTGRPLPDDGPDVLASEAVSGPLPTAPLTAAGGADPEGSDPAEPTTAITPTTPTAPAAAGSSPTTVRPVSPEQKLRLWAGGDSLGEHMGNQLLHPLSDPSLTEIQLDYHVSTGLVRPDFYDWPARISELMRAETPPEALVFMVGGNDTQVMVRDGQHLAIGSPEWRQEYARRVAVVMDTVDRERSHLYWIGLPPMRDQPNHDVALLINEILRREAEGRSWVTFVDIAPTFVGADGNYSSHIVGPDGNQEMARAKDGIHLTATGSTWIAEDVWSAIGEHWSLTPE